MKNLHHPSYWEFGLQALQKQGEFDSARDKFKKAQYYEPNNQAIKDALIELDRYVDSTFISREC